MSLISNHHMIQSTKFLLWQTGPTSSAPGCLLDLKSDHPLCSLCFSHIHLCIILQLHQGKPLHFIAFPAQEYSSFSSLTSSTPSLFSMSPHREAFHDYLKELPILAPAFSIPMTCFIFLCITYHHLTLYLFICLYLISFQ